MTDIQNLLINNLNNRIDKTTELKNSYQPHFFRVGNEEAKEKLFELLKSEPEIKIFDTIQHQLKELIKTLNPGSRLSQQEIDTKIEIHSNNIPLIEYGVWVYYPWNNSLVHLLDEKEFVFLRTNRNKYKITEQEQTLLANKTIGIIGLSVGQAITLTIVMERTCGHLRLADFDTADLSNLNRLRTGVANIGLNKTIIAAREIMEIDPFFDVQIFNEGITTDNIDDFFTKNGKIDLLVEVCDGLDIKIASRYKAKELKIPVVMDTNDRGMLDIERFDLEPDRLILHGLAEGLDPNNIKGLTNEDKVPYILKMVGIDSISTRLKASMIEVEQSISTWPQLASSVALGGALTTDVVRRIFLNQFHDSGRYYVDFDELVADKENTENKNATKATSNPFVPIEKEEIKRIINIYSQKKPVSDYQPTKNQINKIIEAAIIAPSAGNNQPWKWAYYKNNLFLFHDRYRSWSWGDYEGMGSLMSLGTALENIHLQANLLNLEDTVRFFPIEEEQTLAAVISFTILNHAIDNTTQSIAENLHKRFTNRKLGIKKSLEPNFFLQLQSIIEKESNVKLYILDKQQQLDELGKIIAGCDKIRVLHEQGHEEFYNEIKWNTEQAKKDNDGIDLTTVDIKQSEIAGLSIAKDWKAVSLLAKWDKGDAFMKLSINAINAASAILIFTIPEFNPKELILAGKAIEKAWIFANMKGISVHPFLSSVFFFSRLIQGKGNGFPPHIIKELTELRKSFIDIFEPENNKGTTYSEVFIMKLSIADDIGTRSLRKPMNELFFDLD